MRNTSPYLLVETEELVYTVESLGEPQDCFQTWWAILRQGLHGLPTSIITLFVPSGGVWWNPWVVPRLLLHEPVGRCRDCRDRFSGSFQIFEMKMTFMNLWDGVEIIALS